MTPLATGVELWTSLGAGMVASLAAAVGTYRAARAPVLNANRRARAARRAARRR